VARELSSGNKCFCSGAFSHLEPRPIPRLFQETRRRSIPGAYAQDNYKVTSNLTLNLGLVTSYRSLHREPPPDESFRNPNVQRSFGSNWLFRVGYVGPTGARLPRLIRGNQPVLVPGVDASGDPRSKNKHGALWVIVVGDSFMNFRVIRTAASWIEETDWNFWPWSRRSHLALLASLPQHSGRSGKSDRSHPPPRACISNTVFAIRRPRILTPVTSSASAALCAVITSR